MSEDKKYLSVRQVAEVLDLSLKRVAQMCRCGIFKTAHKSGSGRNSHWKVLRIEIASHKFEGHIPESMDHKIFS